MSGNSEPVAAETEQSAPLSHRRILWTMVIVVIIGAILSFVFVSLRSSVLGFIIGGILAFFNYYWLKFA